MSIEQASTSERKRRRNGNSSADSKRARTSGASIRTHGRDTNYLATNSDQITMLNSEAPTTTAAKDQKMPSHIRFDHTDVDSTELATEQLPMSTPMGAMKLNPRADSEDDEDAEPDVLTATEAKTQSRNILAEAEMALHREREVLRQQRQRKDKRLRKQAEAGKNREQKALKRAAPELLPDDILADESTGRSPTPEVSVPIESGAGSPAVKSRRIVFDEEQHKDRQVGPVNVRILQATDQYLAPKANARSKLRREALLGGRRGMDGRLFANPKLKHSFLRPRGSPQRFSRVKSS